jgi:hypothetical protein
VASVSESIITYEDLLGYITALTDGGARTKDLRMHKEVIQGAYRDLAMSYEWRYYIKEGRINLVASYSTGTIQYTASSNTLALTTGSWPSWAKYGRVRIADVIYIIDSISGSNATLDSVFQPTDNIDAGTSYELFRSVYPLPEDLWRLYDVAVEKNYWLPHYITPTEWLQRERFHQVSGQTWAWTIMKDPDDDGRFALWVDPSPSTAEPLGFIYRRKPRALRWAGTEAAARTYTFGTGSAGDTTITTSTALPANMVGSIVRLADSGSTLPTGLAGNSPYAEQQKITAINSGTRVVTLAGTLNQAYTEATGKLVVSDPIDMNDTMIEALKAQIEYRFARFANDQRSTTTARDAADFELRRALEAEARYKVTPGVPQSRFHYMFAHLASTITTDTDL